MFPWLHFVFQRSHFAVAEQGHQKFYPEDDEIYKYKSEM
jgi:hypothetical protein